ncbi:hypothetical protein KRR40_01390 [Niabella defluvii]|nr:hypothetical protein KRR40_01390 [Niabella sp. I65]
MQKKKWTVKISGHQKEKIAAELLAGMYDASLDQFYPHQWNAPYIWRNHYSNYAWTGNTNFGHLQARLQNSLQWGRKTFDRQYDRLYWDNSWGGPIGLAGAVPSVRVKGRVNNDVLEEVAIIGYGTQRKQSVTGAVTNMSADAMASAPAAALEQESKQSLPATTDNSAAPVRTNFNETAFFFPDLKTDKEGNISFLLQCPKRLPNGSSRH